jgi:NTP pyrophosphatase (non-canonical NTP hydrolase)
MDIKDYQEQAWSFAVPEAQQLAYVTYGLVGEVGEYLGKIAKLIRDGYIKGQTWADLEPALKKELGDILWFVAGIATMNGWDLDEIATMNIKKLTARKEVFTIRGDGDDR